MKFELDVLDTDRFSLSLKDAKGNDLQVLFENDEAYSLYFADYPYEINDDALHSIYIIVNKEFVSLYNILINASVQAQGVTDSIERIYDRQDREIAYQSSHQHFI